MSLQQLLRLGNPAHSQADGSLGFSSNSRGQQSSGGQDLPLPPPPPVDLSAAVAKAANFLEKQKAARLRKQRDPDKPSDGRGQRNRGCERSRSRRRSKSLQRRRRERSGSKSNMGRGRPKSVGANRAAKPKPSLSRPRSRARKRVAEGLPEKSLEEVPLLFGGRAGPIAAESGPASGWMTIVSDHERRSFVSYRRGAFSEPKLGDWFHRLRTELRWDRPEVNGRPLPRSACWLTADGCSCTYRYSGTSWANMIMPPWFLDLTDEVCRACGVQDRPNSCNANLYEDETDSVGWHADDEPCFDAKHSDALIISLSLGATRTFVLRPLDDPKAQTKLNLENGDLATMEGLVQKHYLHAVLSDRVARGARINLTWRWVVKHDRDCIRRRDRASTVPIKLGRQASEKKAALKAAARSAAAAVQSSALQNAAASAESARLSRPASAGARVPASRAGTGARRPLGARDGRGTSSDKRRPEQEGRERLSDLVTKGAQAIDEAKRRSDPRVRNALDIGAGTKANNALEDLYDKARKLMGPASPASRKEFSGSQHSERQDQSVGSLLDSLAKPRGKYPKDVSEEPKQDQNRHSHERIEVHTNAREQSSASFQPRGQLVLKPRGLRPVTVYSAADCQQQDRSRGQLPKEDDRGRESPREVSSIDAEIYQKANSLGLNSNREAQTREAHTREGSSRTELDQHSERNHEGTTARVWKARASTGPPTSPRDAHAGDPIVNLRGHTEISQRSAASGQPSPEGARSHRHVVLKSRSRSPKERRAGAPNARREEQDSRHTDWTEEPHRRPVFLESRRRAEDEQSFEQSPSTRHVVTSRAMVDDRGPLWEGSAGGRGDTAGSRARPESDTRNRVGYHDGGSPQAANRQHPPPNDRRWVEDYKTSSHQADRPKRSVADPNGRNIRRHEDGKQRQEGASDSFREGFPEERRPQRHGLDELPVPNRPERARQDRLHREREGLSHQQPPGRQDQEEHRASRSIGLASQGDRPIGARNDDHRYKDRRRDGESQSHHAGNKAEEARRAPRANASSFGQSLPDDRDNLRDKEPRGHAASSHDYRGDRHAQLDHANETHRHAAWQNDFRDKDPWDHSTNRRSSIGFEEGLEEDGQEHRVWREHRSAKQWDTRRPKDGTYAESARQERQDARNPARTWCEATPTRTPRTRR